MILILFSGNNKYNSSRLLILKNNYKVKLNSKEVEEYTNKIVFH